MRCLTNRQLLFFLLLSGGVRSSMGQAVEGNISDKDPKPPVTYHGLIPGLSTAADTRKALGEPEFEAPWYAYKLLYAANKRPGLTDAVYLHGKDGKYANCEAASIPTGFETLDAIVAKLGDPEFELRLATSTMLDYAEKGVRFHVDRDGKTIGVAYFPHLRPRVHSGARKLVNLRKLRQGPQSRPKSPAPVDELTVGVSARTLTPKAEWVDPRYRAKFKVHDDLWARAAVFEKKGMTIALVGVDLFGMGLNNLQPIRDELKKAGIEHTLIAMSHNHAAPDTIGVYGHYPAEYIAHIHKQIVECVKSAHAAKQPVKEFRAASRELPLDGSRVIGYIRNARNPGLVDPTLSVIQVIGKGNKPITTIVHFACHVEGLEAGAADLSADFPGYMCDQISRDGGGQAVFLNGAVGGMITGDTRARTHEEAQAAGLGLAELVKKLAATAQPPACFQFDVDVRRIEIPVTNLKLKPLYGKMGRPLVRGRVVSEMSLATIGETQILGVPGELLPEISFEILEKMSGFPRMIVGLANDELGYIIPPYDFRDDEYEESMSQGPAAGPIIQDTAWRMLQHGGK